MGNRGRKDREGKKIRSCEPGYHSFYATTLVYLVRNTMATIHLRPQTVRPPMTRVSGRGALYISHSPMSKRVIRRGVRSSRIW